MQSWLRCSSGVAREVPGAAQEQLRMSLEVAQLEFRWNSGGTQQTSVEASAVLGRLLAPAHLNSEYFKRYRLFQLVHKFQAVEGSLILGELS